MNNKKFIFLYALFTFFVLNPLYSSNTPSENPLNEIESVKNPNPHNGMENTVPQLKTSVQFPKPIIKIIGEYSDLSTLSSLCRVNKRFHGALQDDLNSLVVDVFYKEVSKNTTFVKKFFEKGSDFEAGLKYLVFGKGSKDHSLTAYKLIRNLPNRSEFETVLPYWIEMKTDFFERIPCAETIYFNYSMVFKLYLNQEKISFPSLCGITDYFNLANRIMAGKSKCYETVTIPNLVRDYWNEKNYSKLKPIFYDLIILHRDIYVEKNTLKNFFEKTESVETLQFIQKLPIDFKNYKNGIPILMEQIKNKILLLAKERMKIIDKLNLYLSIG